MSPNRLVDLAATIADGTPIDWDAVAADPPDLSNELAAHLRIIERIAQVQAGLPPAESFSSSIHKSLLGVALPGDDEADGDVPAAWGPLTIVGRIGRGTFGEVFRAIDPRLNRVVALKLLRRKDRFESAVIEEGHLMSRVRHPNVVTVYGAERIDGRVGFWMELVEGSTLEQELKKRGPFPPDEIATIGADLAKALSAVHRAGLLHRDVKAQNVMRDADGRIVLTDFGAGRELAASSGSPGGGELAGTPLYLAPEVLDGGPASTASDIYSLGTVLFHLATGAYPVHGRSLHELRDAHVRGARVPLRSLRPDFPKRLAATIEQALDPDPALRFTTAESMTGALEAALAPAPPAPRAGRRWLVGAATLIVAAVSALTYQARRSDPAPVPFAARDWVLVTAADNHTGDPSLDAALQHALERELSNSSFVNVVPRSRIEDTLRLMRRPLDTRVDAAVGRELALRDGKIRALLAGRVEKLGDTYAVSTRILNPVDGATTASINEASVGGSDLVSAVGRIAAGVRRQLRDALPTIETGRDELPKVATSSMRALRLYSQALATAGGPAVFGTTGTAEKLLREAIAADPGFVWAHIHLAHAIDARRHRAEVIHHMERAVAVAEPGSVDRYAAEAAFDDFRGDFSSTPVERTTYHERALVGFDAILRIQPDHFWVHGRALSSLRKLRRTPSAERIRQYAELRPNNQLAMADAAEAALAAGYMTDAREYVRRGRAVEGPLHQSDDRAAAGWLASFAARDAWLQGNLQEALAEVDAIIAGPQSRSHGIADGYGLFYFCLGLGRWDCADAVAFRMQPEVTGYRMLLIAAAERGDRDAVHRHFARLSGHGELVGGSDVLAVELVSALVESDMFDQVRQVLAEMKRSPHAGHHPLSTQLFEGMLATSDGRVSHGIQLLERFIQRSDAPPRMAMRASLYLANARAARGETTRAIAVLEEAVARAANTLLRASAVHLRVRDRLAQLYRQVGRVNEAAEIDADLRQLLAVAPDDHPIKRRLTRVERDMTAR